jgi:transposase
MIENRVKEIRQEIASLRSDPNWVVLAADETRLQLESEIRRAWLVRGKRTIIKTERSDEHQNYLGFLDQKYGTCQVFEIDKGNQIETIKVLKKLVEQYPNKRVCVIWDNAKWHKGKLLRCNLSKDKSLERLHLINFPPYAPTHNPIEHVWQYAKSKISNRHEHSFSEIKHDFLASISNRVFDYKI